MHADAWRRGDVLFPLALIGAMAAALALLPAGSPLRVASGLLFLLAPGIAFTAALFPRRELGTLGRLGLSFGFAVALLAPLMLAINTTRAGFSLWMEFTVVSVATGALAIAAIIGRARLSRPTSPAPKRSWRIAHPIVAGLLVLSIIAVGTTAAHIAASPRGETPFVALYALGSDGASPRSPLNASAVPIALRIVLESHESRDRTLILTERIEEGHWVGDAGNATFVAETLQRNTSHHPSLTAHATWSAGVTFQARNATSARWSFAASDPRDPSFTPLRLVLWVGDAPP